MDFLCPNDVKEWLDAPLSSPQRAMVLFVRALAKLPEYKELAVDKDTLFSSAHQWSVDHSEVRKVFEVARIIVEGLDEQRCSCPLDPYDGHRIRNPNCPNHGDHEDGP